MSIDIQNQIDEVRRWIAEARRQVATNARVDLTGLDARIEAICQAVRAPDARGAQSVRGALAGMLRELDDLENDLVRQRDTLMERPIQSVAPSAAASAYGKRKSD